MATGGKRCSRVTALDAGRREKTEVRSHPSTSLLAPAGGILSEVHRGFPKGYEERGS
jgi:hypothetical protein